MAITIPAGLEFSALQLSRDPVTGSVSFDWKPIETICAASGIDSQTFRAQHEDNVAGLIVAWYVQHRQGGGLADPVAEQLLAEVEAEDQILGAGTVDNLWEL